MAKFSLINRAGIQWLISKIKGHTENKNNPHGVTKSQIGLSKVSNLDQSKAISKVTNNGTTFTGTALDGSTTKWNMPNAITAVDIITASDGVKLQRTNISGSTTSYFPDAADGNAGVTKLYNFTGSNTDGAITQKAATDAINNVNNKIIYTNDGSNNITFPKQVTATQFNGSLNGNAKTATTATTANSATTATTATTADKVSNSLKIQTNDGTQVGPTFNGSSATTITLPITKNPIIIRENVTLNLTKATADTTYADYPYAVKINIPTCTPEHYPQVVLKNNSDGVYISSVCNTSLNNVTFYVTKNTGTIVLATIILIRGTTR